MLGSPLIICPGTDTSSASLIIDPLTGGVLELAGHRVEIPAGAVLEPILLTLRVPASRYMEIEVTVLGFERFLFELPVSVTISYTRCSGSNLGRTPLTVWYIDTATKALLEHMGGVDDKQTRTVTFTTGHLSSYAIAD